jgi:glycosyltransferase involved in cell wall biosynthesis
LPRHHEHAYNEDVLRIEELEYQRAYRLLCPSAFVVKTFYDRGFQTEKIARHIYGVDDTLYHPFPDGLRRSQRGLTVLFVGVCAVRKGVHFALEAWLRSPASADGQFLIAGEFLPEYARKLESMLSHPSVKVLGHRKDVPELMRRSDVLVLPSVEEGFGLVVTEAMASGCVPLASDACTELCEHLVTGLVHNSGDVDTLSNQMTLLHRDRALLARLRQTGLAKVPEVTWAAAGTTLVNVYRETIAMHARVDGAVRVHSGSAL